MATRQLATERTGEALGAYQQHDAIHVAETREAARVDLIDRWIGSAKWSPTLVGSSSPIPMTR